MAVEHSRVQRLGRRVSWLDRYRRPITTVIGIVVALAVVGALYDGNSPAWSRFYSLMMGLLVGTLTWVTLEVVLAWLTAFWETEATHVARDPGLPRARVHKVPKRKTAAGAAVHDERADS
jgi:hypothetical protein